MVTMRDKFKHLEEKGATFDYAYPVEWARVVEEKTGLWPHGIVWLYDEVSPYFGRPYAVTLYGWIVLKMFEEGGK